MSVCRQRSFFVFTFLFINFLISLWSLFVLGCLIMKLCYEKDYGMLNDHLKEVLSSGKLSLDAFKRWIYEFSQKS